MAGDPALVGEPSPAELLARARDLLALGTGGGGEGGGPSGAEGGGGSRRTSLSSRPLGGSVAQQVLPELLPDPDPYHELAGESSDVIQIGVTIYHHIQANE